MGLSTLSMTKTSTGAFVDSSFNPSCSRSAVKIVGPSDSGIVRDPALHQAAIDKVTAAALAAGFSDPQHLPSPITGADGNQEFLLRILFS